jgi:hypothetical protein
LTIDNNQNIFLNAQYSLCDSIWSSGFLLKPDSLDRGVIKLIQCKLHASPHGIGSEYDSPGRYLFYVHMRRATRGKGYNVVSRNFSTLPNLIYNERSIEPV